jgi:hypothetical protein
MTAEPTPGEGRTPREYARELKCWPIYFDDIVSGAKTWEVRRNDAEGFGAGCWIRLREWDPDRGRYTGREVDRFVTYVAALDRLAGMDGLVGMTLVADPSSLLPSAPEAEGGRERIAELEKFINEDAHHAMASVIGRLRLRSMRGEAGVSVGDIDQLAASCVRARAILGCRATTTHSRRRRSIRAGDGTRCPPLRHGRGTGMAAERPKLTAAQDRHLREMAKDGPFWMVRHAGEIRCGIALAGMGLVRSVWNGGLTTFEITDAGRAAVPCPVCEDDCYVDIPDEETGGVLGPGPCPRQNEPWHIDTPAPDQEDCPHG